MGAISRKLKSQRGVSMLMALLYLTVALILGASVLAAAQVNAGRIGRNKAEQQAYYTLSSAAGLIEQDMSGASLSFTSTAKVVKTWDSETGDFGPESRPPVAKSVNIGSGSTLIYSLRPELTEFYSVTDSIQGTKTIELSFSPVEELAQVKGSVKFIRGGDEAYAVVYELYTEYKGVRSGELSLSFAPIADSSSERTETTENGVNTVTTVDTTKVSWDKPTVVRGATA